MSAAVVTDTNDLVELLAMFSAEPGYAENNGAVLFKSEQFDVWGDSGDSFVAPVLGCTCFRVPDEPGEFA